MHRFGRILIFSICIFLLMGGILFSAEHHSLTIRGEQFSSVIEVQNEKSFRAEIFIAFASMNDTVSREKLYLTGIKAENVQSCTISDSLFYDARYIREPEQYFHNDLQASISWKRLNQSMENFGIFLFQQPFWSMHLAFKLPTSLLEWQLVQKEEPSGIDLWSEIYGTSEPTHTDDLTIENEQSEQNNGFLTVSYTLPVSSDDLNTRGLMISCSASFTDKETMLNAMNELINITGIDLSDGGIIEFPIKRVYITGLDAGNVILMESDENFKMDEHSLINRINARESGIYTFSDALVASESSGRQRIINKNIVYSSNLRDFPDLTLATPSENDLRKELRKVADFPTRPDLLRILVFTLLKGLMSWLVLFWIFHRSILTGMPIYAAFKISLASYFIYMLVSTLFCYMFGFGFLLGVIAMVSWLKTRIKSVPSITLFVNGLMTSMCTSLIVYLLSVFSI